MIARFLRKSLYWFWSALIFAFSGVFFALFQLTIFEYGEGLHDISLHEWLFLALSALLFWRYCIHCSNFRIPWGTRISRILMFLGGLALLDVLVFMALVLSGVFAGEDLHSVLAEPKLIYISDGIFWLGTLLTLYLASPCPGIEIAKQLPSDNIPVVQSEDVPLQSYDKEQI